MIKHADLTVLLTIYNGRDHMQNTIDSFKAMDTELSLGLIVNKVKVIIIDDGSEDGSGKLLRDELADLSVISCLNYKFISRSGRAKALNYGLAMCDTDLLAIHDVDDTFYTNRFENAIKAKTKNNYDLYLPGGHVCKLGGKTIRRVMFTRPPSQLRELTRVICPHTFWTWDAKTLSAISGYSEKQDRLIDFEAFLRSKRLGLNVQYDIRPAGKHFKYASFFARKRYSVSQKEFRRLLFVHFKKVQGFRNKSITILAWSFRLAVATLRRGRDK